MAKVLTEVVIDDVTEYHDDGDRCFDVDAQLIFKLSDVDAMVHGEFAVEPVCFGGLREGHLCDLENFSTAGSGVTEDDILEIVTDYSY